MLNSTFLEFVSGAAWCGLLECDTLLAVGGRCLMPGDPAVWGASGKCNHWCLLWRLQEEGGRMAWSRAVGGNFLLPGCILTSSLPQHAALTEVPLTALLAAGHLLGPPLPWNELF